MPRPKGSLNKSTIAKQQSQQLELNKSVEQTISETVSSLLTKQDISKVTGANQAVSRLKLGEVGYTGTRILGVTQSVIDEEQKTDLRFPNCLWTYDLMMYDASIAMAMDFRKSTIENSFSFYDLKYNPKSAKSIKASKFIKYCLENMQTSLRTVVREALTAEKYGFSLLYKVYKANDNLDEFPDYPYMIDVLSPRAQKSLDLNQPFKMDKNGRTILGVRQSINYLSPFSNLLNDDKNKDPDIQTDLFMTRDKLMVFAPNAVNGNPIAQSTLYGCYTAWREKCLLTDLEMVGIDSK